MTKLTLLLSLLNKLQFNKILLLFRSNNTKLNIGRWNLDYDKKFIKFDYANEDHCGVCHKK